MLFSRRRAVSGFVEPNLILIRIFRRDVCHSPHIWQIFYYFYVFSDFKKKKNYILGTLMRNSGKNLYFPILIEVFSFFFFFFFFFTLDGTRDSFKIWQCGFWDKNVFPKKREIIRYIFLHCVSLVRKPGTIDRSFSLGSALYCALPTSRIPRDISLFPLF